MSRTDRHRPWRVQEQDPFERPHWYRVNDGHYTTRWSLYGMCSCRLCSGYHWRKTEARAARHDARRRCHEVVKGVTDAFDFR